MAGFDHSVGGYSSIMTASQNIIPNKLLSPNCYTAGKVHHLLFMRHWENYLAIQIIVKEGYFNETSNTSLNQKRPEDTFKWIEGIGHCGTWGGVSGSPSAILNVTWVTVIQPHHKKSASHALPERSSSWFMLDSEPTVRSMWDCRGPYVNKLSK